MTYDEDLAHRLRAALPTEGVVTERKMFGGLAFMLDGHMLCGVMKESVMLRLGPDAAERALNHPRVRPMDFTGRPMTGMVYVDPDGLDDGDLRRWIAQAADFTRSLPPKPGKRA